MTERLWAMKREVDGFVRWYGPGCHGWGFSWASPVAVEEHHLPSASAGGTVVEFVPATELEQAQEEARVLRRAHEVFKTGNIAMQRAAAEEIDLLRQVLEQECRHKAPLRSPERAEWLLAQARDEAKPTDGGGE